MGEMRWDCYHYDSSQRATFTNRSRQIPPAVTAREWRGEVYKPCLIGSYTDVAEALRRIEDEIAKVSAFRDTYGTWVNPDRLGLIRDAAEALAGREAAWQWRRDLADGTVVVLAVRGYWTTNAEPPTRSSARQDAPAEPETARLRRPRPERRRFTLGGPPPDQHPNQ